MMTTVIEHDFRQAIESAGLTPPAEIIDDGKLHRFASNGDRKDEAGWYVLYSDGMPAGVFGCWRTGVKETWCLKPDRPLTNRERAEYQDRVAGVQRQRDEEEGRRHAEAAEQAQRIWDTAQPASDEHQYLQRKGVRPHGLRVGSDGRLIVPIYRDGGLSSLQFIDGNGEKRYLSGGAKHGGFFTIGDDKGATHLLECEGYATASSVYDATGLPTVTAFDAHNLRPVAEVLHRQYPNAVLVVCADNDVYPDGKPNTGVEAATNAAQAVNGRVAIPHLDGCKVDWNDVLKAKGLSAVREDIMAVVNPMSASVHENLEPWPTLDETALYGLPGRFVRAIEPFSEADPVAILLTLLSALGAVIGPGPHVNVEHFPHPARSNVLLVGRTAGGRKGTSFSHVRMLLKRLDREFLTSCVKSGLSSGEGLVYQVRDAEGDDPGVSDKRLLVVESEFASALRVMEREGNTLSPKIRDAWDNGNLTPLTKRDRLSATEAHIAIIGHISQDELLRALAKAERMNGFANRFLFVVVRRSKLLPEGKGAPQSVLDEAFLPFSRVFSVCAKRKELTRDAECEALWAKVYPLIEEEIPGVAGAILARGAAQVLRLSLIYSLFDEAEAVHPAPAIRVPHLLAALAIWDYCKASVFQIFGDATGDYVADRYLRALKEKPHTDSELYDLIGRHHGDGSRKEKALDLLVRLERIHSIKTRTDGRPVRQWHCGALENCRTCALRVKSPV